MKAKRNSYPLQQGTCVRLFTAALITTAKSWEQSKCPSMGAKVEKPVANTVVKTVECSIMVRHNESQQHSKIGVKFYNKVKKIKPPIRLYIAREKEAREC